MLMRKLLFIVLILSTVLLMPLFAQEQETLAVLDFTTEAVSKIEMGAIVEFLSAELFNTDKYIVIDVSQRETILNEMEFSMSGCSDDSCALEIGKMLSAELIVVGNLSKVGSRYLMSVKMLETETSRTMGTANGKYADLDELIDGLETIAFTLAGMEEQLKSVEKTPVKEPEPEPEVVEEARDEPEALSLNETKSDNDQEVPEKTKEIKPRSSVPAIICTTTGIAGIGVGGYFLYSLFNDTLPVYIEAKAAYDAAYGDEAEYQSLYDSSYDAYDDAFLDFIIGAGAAGLGVVLTTVGIILFPPKADKSTASVSFSPVISNNPGMIIKVSY